MSSMHDYGFPYSPYPVQRELMDALTRAMDEGAIGLFESPTGTGKTLAIICATMTWLLKHRLDPAVSRPSTASPTPSFADNVPDDGPDWVQTQAAQRKISELQLVQHHREAVYRERLERAMSQARGFGVGTRGVRAKRLGSSPSCSRRGKRKRSDADHEKRFLADCYGPNERSSSHDELGDLESVGVTEPEKDDFPVDASPRLRIIFATRTHSQIAQFIGEFRKTQFGSLGAKFHADVQSSPMSDCRTDAERLPISVVAFGSRKVMCVNDSVRTLPTSAAVSERCRELLSDNGKPNSIVPGTRRRKPDGAQLSGCPFRNESVERDLRDMAIVRTLDVEQVVALGAQRKGCPYFASRSALSTGAVDVIALPYAALLHEPTRESLGIEVDRQTVVVFDEAHNLVNSVADIHSATVTRSQLTSTRSAVWKYVERYESRLGAQSLFFVRQLLGVLSGLLKLLPDTAAVTLSSTTAHKARVVSLSGLVFECEIENVNIFKLLTFLRESRLWKKLLGFVDAGFADDQISPGSNSGGERIGAPSIGASLDARNREDIQSQKKHSIAVFESFLRALNCGNDSGRVAIYPPGSGPRKEQSGLLKYFVLNPGSLFASAVGSARAVLLLGGTLSPRETLKSALLAGFSTVRPCHEFECGHVVPRRNLSAVVLSKGPGCTNFEFTHRTRENSAAMDDLGNAVLDLASVAPGGLVIFFASYSFMQIVTSRWRTTSCATRLNAIKPVFIECRGETTAFDDYSAAIGRSPRRGAILAAVLGGRLSEGINFSDDLGRVVLVVGMPFANARDVETAEALRILPDAWHRAQYLENACMTVVNQAIGRAIRHKGDYATVVLCDTRFARLRFRNKLPRFVREAVRVSEDFHSVPSELSTFFNCHSP